MTPSTATTLARHPVQVAWVMEASPRVTRLYRPRERVQAPPPAVLRA